MKENSNFIEIMSGVQEGDQITNQLGTVFSVGPNKILKCTSGSDETIYGLNNYGFLSPSYTWSIVPRLKSWKLSQRIRELTNSFNSRYFVGSDPIDIDNRCVFISVRMWGYGLSQNGGANDKYTVFSSINNTRGLVNDFLNKFRPKGDYKQEPDDLNDLVELVQSVSR